MHFEPPLVKGTLVKRYKRFLADVELETGEIITAHCPNPGSMRSCQEPGWPVCLSHNPSPKRKLAYTLEMLYNGSCWIGVNTLRTNALIAEALQQKQIAELVAYHSVKPEVRYGENSRVDFLLTQPGLPDCYLEIKHVSLLLEKDYAFPDAVTSRGLKHLNELLAMQAQGARAVLLFAVQRSDGYSFRAAHEIDPTYAEGLQKARLAGLEVLVYGVEVSPLGLGLGAALPF
ncbi:DNA/RNA nuclease SfsA [bacterium (Candidatus Blackallbacteria) CG17_big_fil_post_rev_8_21_14_2_50_48_46]|uniref:Sugar fermentation stimulation protein homolog n=1 Tax=bacterium (Candidatus Blackallbacteria) CG17_big_fil_post_rev_8_21_14_2_50_48_46 TaxID=2014261 RepID=A0A2M7G0H2_9BACT|nr:MAG: DNA/RNA nuclease SfsA [bacterium (Candidatus Blackallbacteria) CG18_big_fil_WC_8_21_14_2_50_49_26]PIW15211.1 MAG: DNA/RNA nuclease SfsA [bacterium (Candidatus Blackallbacteria) CG17_big_fil_post_rev_8_21_14_2_50_48_46]PIW44798.1 MAG: DNA/RNA nuclease SfsA [bacterium (Candidatus Blackallbacteria) CG13_big_fil_rev_8_21_14_2_50_49_14]